MVAAVSGDHHSLPTAMATAALREDNWHVEHLGADMPVEELVSFADTHDIDLAVLSATTTRRGQLAEEARQAISGTLGIPALVGRPGASLQELQAEARSMVS